MSVVIWNLLTHIRKCTAACILHLPGQIVSGHVSVSLYFPIHIYPPYAGVGTLQLRFRVFTPMVVLSLKSVQDMEHGDHAVQSVQLPSTEM